MPTSLSRSAAISAGAIATITPAASDYSNPGQELPDTALVGVANEAARDVQLFGAECPETLSETPLLARATADRTKNPASASGTHNLELHAPCLDTCSHTWPIWTSGMLEFASCPYIGRRAGNARFVVPARPSLRDLR